MKVKAEIKIISVFRDWLKVKWLLLLITMCCLISLTSMAQPAADEYRVLLISNLDDVKDSKSTMDAFEQHMNSIYAPFSLIINGDFGSVEGMLMVRQLAVWMDLHPENRLILLQGDRDWADSGPDGWEEIQKIQKQIKKYKMPKCVVDE